MGKPFGYLLTLDLYEVKPGICDDIKACYTFLNDLVDKLKMTKMCPPFIFYGPPEYPDKAGVSGWVGLIESGIQLHTLSPKNFVSIDVYSCQEFSKEGIAEYCKEYFGAKEVESDFILRGTKYYE
jgi:S-adenosylmethionine decarboxylase